MRQPHLVLPLWSFLIAAVGCIEAPERLTFEAYEDRFLEQTDTSNKSDVKKPDVPDGNDSADASDGSDGEDSQDGSDGVDGSDDVVDGDTEGDTGPVCTPHPRVSESELGPALGDFCNGLDDDCDGVTDNGAHPPKATLDFKERSGWLRSTTRGVVPHETGPIGFRGLADVGTVVWTKTRPWSGDLEFKANVVLASVGRGTEWFIGAFTGDNPYPAPAGRTGFIVSRTSDAKLRIQVIVADAIVAETEASPGTFLGVLFRLTTATQRVLVQLQKGDGSSVAEAEATEVALVPSYDGFAVAVTGGPLLGNVPRIEIRETPDCESEPIPPCDACVAAANCLTAVCNPLAGCEDQTLTCGLSTDCMDVAACDLATNACAAPTPKNEGGACEIGEYCIVGSVCASGACTGGAPLACAPATTCQEEAGNCQTYLGCVYPSKLDGSACDDGTLCTGPDACTDGSCAGAAVVCPTNGPCETVSACDPAAGTCSAVTPVADGTACEDGDLCTDISTCTTAICVGTPKNCDDGLGCTLDSCEPVAGACVHTGSLDCLLFSTPVSAGPIGALTLSPDGRILATFATGISALSGDGAIAWTSADLIAPTSRGASIHPNGTSILVGDASGGPARLASLNLEGALQWSLPIPGTSCEATPASCHVVAIPTIGTDATIYASTQTGLHAVTVTDDGSGPVPSVLWSFATHFGAGASVTRSITGALYAGQGGPEPRLVSLSLGGELRWFWVASDAVTITPAVAGSAIVVVAGSVLTGLSDAGVEAQTLFSFTSDAGPFSTQPAITDGGQIVAGAGSKLWLIDPFKCAADPLTCIVWSSDLQGPARGGVVLLSDGQLTASSGDALALLSRADGVMAWSLPLTGLAPGVPVITDGRLTFATGDGKVHAAPYTAGVGVGTGPWPVFGRNQQRNAIE